jgi:hypothetical protein
MRPTRLTPIVLSLLALALLAGCGSSGKSGGYGNRTSSDTSVETTDAGGAGAPSEAGGGAEAPAGARAHSCPHVTGAEQLRVTGLPCALGRLASAAWHKNTSCFSPTDASRTSCKMGTLTCLATSAPKGWEVSCATKGGSIAFLAPRP